MAPPRHWLPQGDPFPAPSLLLHLTYIKRGPSPRLSSAQPPVGVARCLEERGVFPVRVLLCWVNGARCVAGRVGCVSLGSTGVFPTHCAQVSALFGAGPRSVGPEVSFCLAAVAPADRFPKVGAPVSPVPAAQHGSGCPARPPTQACLPPSSPFHCTSLEAQHASLRFPAAGFSLL